MPPLSPVGRILAGMDVRRTFRGLPLGGVAAVGVVAGHWLAYAISVPNAQLRAEVLQSTGHGYWGIAVKLVAAVGFAAFATLALRLLAGDPSPDRTRGRTYAALLWRLALIQLAAFSAMEAFERLGAGVPLSDLWSHHLFLLGLVVQLVVAAVAALVALLFTRAVLWLAGSPRRPRIPVESRPPLPRMGERVRRPLLRGAILLRAPPSA
jgi:hypothetical protein